MESATWRRTPAAASAGRRLRPEVSKNSSTALSSNEGELARSITTCAPARASLSPSPVMVLSPYDAADVRERNVESIAVRIPFGPPQIKPLIYVSFPAAGDQTLADVSKACRQDSKGGYGRDAEGRFFLRFRGLALPPSHGQYGRL